MTYVNIARAQRRANEALDDLDHELETRGQRSSKAIDRAARAARHWLRLAGVTDAAVYPHERPRIYWRWYGPSLGLADWERV